MPGRGKGKAKKRRKVSGEVTEDPDDPETFFVEELVDHRGEGMGGRTEYLVRWLGYAHADNTWEPDEGLPRVPVIKYRARHDMPLTPQDRAHLEKLHEDGLLPREGLVFARKKVLALEAATAAFKAAAASGLVPPVMGGMLPQDPSGAVRAWQSVSGMVNPMMLPWQVGAGVPGPVHGWTGVQPGVPPMIPGAIPTMIPSAIPPMIPGAVHPGAVLGPMVFPPGAVPAAGMPVSPMSPTAVPAISPPMPPGPASPDKQGVAVWPGSNGGVAYFPMQSNSMLPGGVPQPWLPMTFPVSPTGTQVVLPQPVSIGGVHKDRVAQVDGTSPKGGDTAVSSPLSVRPSSGASPISVRPSSGASPINVQPPSGVVIVDVDVKTLPPLSPLVVDEPSASAASADTPVHIQNGAVSPPLAAAADGVVPQVMGHAPPPMQLLASASSPSVSSP